MIKERKENNNTEIKEIRLYFSHYLFGIYAFLLLHILLSGPATLTKHRKLRKSLIVTMLFIVCGIQITTLQVATMCFSSYVSIYNMH